METGGNIAPDQINPQQNTQPTPEEFNQDTTQSSFDYSDHDHQYNEFMEQISAGMNQQSRGLMPVFTDEENKFYEYKLKRSINNFKKR